MPLIDHAADSLHALVAYVLAITDELTDHRSLWFRGSECSQFELLPKLLRAEKTADEVFDRERRLLTRFRQRSMAYWPAGYPQNDWEHLFAMQHFGMPTRLLDWSENLFVASYFALSKAAPSDHTDHTCVPVVWCLDPVEWNRATPVLSEFGEGIQVLTTADDELKPYEPATSRKRLKSPLAMFGSHNSERIVAQRGSFMIWGSEFTPLENLASAAEARLWRIELVGEAGTLFRQLRSLGFGETMVYPDLPSLAEELTDAEGWRS